MSAVKAPKPRLDLVASGRATVFAMVVGLVSGVLGCTYGDMVVHPKNGKIYIQRRDLFLFGALRKLYECTPDGAGHVACVQLDGRP